MKKTPSKSAPKSVRAPKAPSWDKVKTFPVKLFHTFRGPLMGLVDPSIGKTVRLWAPAMLMRNPQNVAMVAYLPLDFVENYVDLSPITMVGSSPAPEVIVEGYRGFAEEFSVGTYMMRPVAIGAGIETSEKTETPPAPVAEPVVSQGMVPCPGCDREVSNWRAHYPVHVMLKEDGSLGAALGEGQYPITDDMARWICEMTWPNVREAYPDYVLPATPPRAVTASLH